MGVGTYLITFACYGVWLPGKLGAIDRDHNAFGGRLLDANPVLEAGARQRMKAPAYLLTEDRRRLVLDAIQGVCSYRSWKLLAAHVRTTHVHVVIETDRTPEHIMITLKAYASRALNRVEPEQRR